MTLRVQIAIALGSLAALAAISAALFSYTSVERRLQEETDALLDTRTAQALTLIAERAAVADGGPDVSPTDGPAGPSGVAGIARFDVEVQLFRAERRVFASTPSAVLPVPQADIDEALRSQAALSSRLTVDDRTFETRLVGFDGPSGERAVLHLGRDISGQVDTLSELRLRLLLLVAGVVVASAGAGYVLASRLVRPLEKLRDATRAVAGTKDFSASIPVEGTGEISDVASDFNLMLAKVDESLLQQRRLVQDASHELRSPLSTVRANVELAQRMELRRTTGGHDGTEQELEHVVLLGAALDEVDELSRLVDELVNLASFPFDESPLERLHLGTLACEAVQAFRARHPQRTITLRMGDNQPVRGKRAHLTRAITNVLANAAKFTDAHSVIDVGVDANRISVSDRGPGILDEDLDRIFDKFYRSPSVQSIEGSGLGLAFVADVIRGHDGTVHAENRNGGGATISLDIPPAL